MSITIMIVDDEENARIHIGDFLSSKGYELVLCETLNQARERLKRGEADVVLLDVQLPDGYGPNLLYDIAQLPHRPPSIIITAYGDIDMAVEAMRNGALDFLSKPIEFDRLEQSIQKAVEIVILRRELAHLRQIQKDDLQFVIGDSPHFKNVILQAKRAARASVSVLVTGETGTGKEIIAKFIHQQGPRTGKSFIGVNCAAIQHTVLESELFGYEAIVKGTVFFQKIQTENYDDLAFIDGLFAERTLRLGRSRSAEYGIVRLEKHSPGNTGRASPCKNGVVSLYLLSDMALVRDGMPTLVPRAEDFGLKEAGLIPDRCFMRSRSYSPWNAFYNCRMTERNVLCKGSVMSFEVRDMEDIESLQRNLSRGVGLYREEGMGQVLVNPEWLLQPPVLRKASAHEPKGISPSKEWKSPLTLFLREKIQQQKLSRRAFEDGLELAKEWFRLSEKIARTGQMVPGKSQWSAIRSLADRYAGDRKSLLDSLEEFCTKGMRRKKWQSVVRESGKDTCLYDKIREQIERPCDEPQKTHDEYAILTLHHASVEMGRMLARPAEEKGRVRSR